MSDPTKTKTSLDLDLPKALQLVASAGASPQIRAIGALTAAALLLQKTADMLADIASNGASKHSKHGRPN